MGALSPGRVPHPEPTQSEAEPGLGLRSANLFQASFLGDHGLAQSETM